MAFSTLGEACRRRSRPVHRIGPSQSVWPAAVAALLMAAAAVVPVPAAPPASRRDAAADADPATLRKDALAAARSGSPARRKAILERLATREEDDRLDLVVRVGLSSKDATVRAAARAVLAGIRGAEGGEEALCDRGARELREGRPAAAADILAVLVAAEASTGVAPVAAWLADAGPAGVKLCWSVATEAAGRAEAADVAALAGLARLPLFEADYPFRRGVVRALVAVNRLDAVEALTAILADLRGEARADVIAYLAFVTGRNFGTDAAAWAAWVAEHRDEIVLPPQQAEYPAPRGPLESADNHRDPAYYGIPLYAERLVFLVDVSSSMEERGRLEKAKRELESAVRVLPASTAFTVIAYSDGAVAWEKRLVPADEPAKERALAFIRRLQPDGRTATGDALALAFTLDVEAVYLLSDGHPTAGRVVEPERIIRMVAEANATRRVSIHAIGLAPDPGLAEFLEVLARANYGRFHRVDD